MLSEKDWSVIIVLTNTHIYFCFCRMSLFLWQPYKIITIKPNFQETDVHKNVVIFQKFDPTDIQAGFQPRFS